MFLGSIRLWSSGSRAHLLVEDFADLADILKALYGTQTSNMEMMHQYMGLYQSVVSVDRLYDEKNWPLGLGMIEIETRRRLVSFH